QALLSAHAGRYAQIDLGMTKVGTPRFDVKISHHHHLKTTPQRVAADSCGSGLPRGSHMGIAAKEVTAVDVAKAQRLHFFNICTRSKGFPTARQHQTAL